MSIRSGSLVPMLIRWIVILYLGLGVFPVAPIEDDSTLIAANARWLARGRDAARLSPYRYEAQAGTYGISVLGARLFQIDPLVSISLGSAAGAVAVVVLSGLLAARLLSMPFSLCCLTTVLFHEAWVAGFYGNTSALAVPFAAGSLYLLAGRNRWARTLAAGCLLALAGWIRCDALLFLPTCLTMICCWPGEAATDPKAPAVPNPRFLRPPTLFGVAFLFACAGLFLLLSWGSGSDLSRL